MIKFILILLLPFLFTGLINKLKAVFVGKKGASIFQQYYDFIKLVQKGEVFSTTSSFVFQLAPAINLVCTLLAAIIVVLWHFEGDFILFAYILALGKFLSVIAAMDTGSSFEGMGASREVSYTSFVEPAFFIIISSIAALKGIYSFESLFSLFGIQTSLISFIVVAVLFMMILIEGSRTPIDDPKTHLELTMIHEVMVLDNSGVDLAFINYASALKMLIFSTIIGAIFFGNSILGYLVVYILTALAIAIIETIGARIRLTHIIEYTFIMISLALVVMSLVLSSLFKGGF